MENPEDYLDFLDNVFFDWEEFDNFDQFLKKVMKDYKPVNYTAWTKETKANFNSHMMDHFAFKREESTKKVTEGVKLLKDNNLKVSDKREANLRKALHNFHRKDQKSTKAQRKEVGRIVQFRAKELRDEGVNKSEALRRAWNDFK